MTFKTLWIGHKVIILDSNLVIEGMVYLSNIFFNSWKV